MGRESAPSGDSTSRDAGSDERTLVEGLVAGEQSARDELLVRTHHAVYCLACRLTRDSELRQDWTHEVLLGILADLEQGRFVYTRPGGFWAWFRKRAYFRLLDELRRRRRRSDREVEPADPDAHEWAQMTGADDPADELERVELRRAIEACLERVPHTEQRRALWMLLFEDCTYEQIADTLAAPLNTVRAWIRRARIAVRDCVSQRLGLQAKAAAR